MSEEQKQEPGRALALVMSAGRTLLENGGEVFRAQQTMEIMARSLGFTDFHVYVLTNGIFASVGTESLNELFHIPAAEVNLGHVEAVNQLSRELADGRLDLPGAEQRMVQIRAAGGYDARLCLLAGAIGSGCFAYLFGGSWPDMLVATLAGALEMLLTRVFRRWKINKIFTDIVAAAACTMVALGCRALFPAVVASRAIIGALMVLTPGVALVMGIRDFINADYLSGTIRLIDAVLIAGSLACGVGFAYTLARDALGVLL